MSVLTVNARAFARPVLTNLGGFMTEYERDLLVALARIVMPRTVMEIGVQEGQAARMLLDNVPSITRYVGVDTFEGYVCGLPEQHRSRERPPQPGALVAKDTRFRLILHPRGSFDLKLSSGDRYDMVIIDGDHSKAAVEHDTNLADKSVNKNSGIIVWHDYGAWCKDITDFLDARHRAGHHIYHGHGTMLAWEMV